MIDRRPHQKIRLATTAAAPLAAGLLAAGCSLQRLERTPAAASAAASSPALGSSARRSSTASRQTASLSTVTLNVGDQAGTGAQALLEAAGLMNKLPFKVNWPTSPPGRRCCRP